MIPTPRPQRRLESKLPEERDLGGARGGACCRHVAVQAVLAVFDAMRDPEVASGLLLVAQDAELVIPP
jgi:hypothetical protein